MGKSGVKILFLLRNGIGFGHFKRALCIAEKLHEKGCKMFFITQAKSYQIFIDKGFQVYNFPLVETISNNNAQNIVYDIINKIINEIDPDLILEDTNPEEYYLSLPAVKSRRKALILRRIGSENLLNYINNGIYNEYEKVLFMSDKDELISNLHFHRNKLILKYSTKFNFYGDVFDEVNVLKKGIINNYCNNGEKLITINCGAGGIQLGEDVCSKIFNSVVNVIPKLQRNFNNKLKFLIITGSYNNFTLDKVIADKFGVIVKRYESSLANIIKESDLCILRPGYNVTMEALSGKSEIILLPGISYMEDHLEWCKELCDKYGAHYLPVDELSGLYKKIKYCLQHKSRKSKPVNYLNQVSISILKIATSPTLLYLKKRICVVFNQNEISNKMRIITRLESPINNSSQVVAFIDDGSGLSCSDYDGVFNLKEHNILGLNFIKLNCNTKLNNLKQQINNHLNNGETCFLMDLVDDIEKSAKINNYLISVGASIVSVDEMISEKCNSLLKSFKWTAPKQLFGDLK